MRSVRAECLDLIIIINVAHLRRGLIELIHYYNDSRPHQFLDQQIPVPSAVSPEGTIQWRDILGGIIHNY